MCGGRKQIDKYSILINLINNIKPTVISINFFHLLIKYLTYINTYSDIT